MTSMGFMVYMAPPWAVVSQDAPLFMAFAQEEDTRLICFFVLMFCFSILTTKRNVLCMHTQSFDLSAFLDTIWMDDWVAGEMERKGRLL